MTPFPTIAKWCRPSSLLQYPIIPAKKVQVSDQFQFQYKCLVVSGTKIRYQEYMPDNIWKNVPNNIRNI